MEAVSSEMGQVDTEEVDIGSQQEVLEDFTREFLVSDTAPPLTMTYGRLVESNKSKLNRSGLSRHTLERMLASVSSQLDYIENTFAVETVLFTHRPTPTSFCFTSVARGKNYNKLLQSETGKKVQSVIREASKRFPRPDPEKHLGYKNVLVKAGKQLQVEEEINQVKDPVASKEALERVAQAEALKAKKLSKTLQDKNDWITKKNPNYKGKASTSQVLLQSDIQFIMVEQLDLHQQEVLPDKTITEDVGDPTAWSYQEELPDQSVLEGIIRDPTGCSYHRPTENQHSKNFLSCNIEDSSIAKCSNYLEESDIENHLVDPSSVNEKVTSPEVTSSESRYSLNYCNKTMDPAAFAEAITSDCNNLLSSRTSLATESGDLEALQAFILTQRKRGENGESSCSSGENIVNRQTGEE